MAEGIESLGSIGQKIINKQNLEYILVQRASDVLFNLKTAQLKGLPRMYARIKIWLTKLRKGYIFDTTSGISMKGTIGLFEKPTVNPPADISSVRHETGHELDKLFNKVIGIDFTKTKGYTEAYLKDLANLPENLKKYRKKIEGVNDYIDYITQGSTKKTATSIGKSESFADFFATLNGGSTAEKFSKGMDELYRKVFPNTVAYVQKLLWFLGKR